MSKQVRIAAIAIAFAMMLAPTGCSAINKAGRSSRSSSTTSLTTAKAETSLPGRWTADGLAQAFLAINAKIGANPADYLKILLLGQSVKVEAVNPQKRQNVDQYEFDGTSVGVAPVDVSSSEPGAIEDNVFKSDTVKPEVLLAVMGSAVKDSGLEDVKLDDVLTVQKNLPFHNDPGWLAWTSRVHALRRSSTTT